MHKFISIFLLPIACLIIFTILNAKITNQIILSPEPDLAFADQTGNGKIAQPETTQLADFSPSPTLINITSLDTPSPSPTPILSSSTTPQPIPKLQPTTAPTPISKTPIPSPTLAPQSTSVPIVRIFADSLDGNKILNLINNYRRSKGLPELVKDQRSCDLAASRAPEIMHEVKTDTMHSGLAARNLPYWDNENIAYYNTEEQTVNWWIADTIHRKQLEGNFKYSCVECYHNSCAQELTNFSPK